MNKNLEEFKNEFIQKLKTKIVFAAKVISESGELITYARMHEQLGWTKKDANYAWRITGLTISDVRRMFPTKEEMAITSKPTYKYKGKNKIEDRLKLTNQTKEGLLRNIVYSFLPDWEKDFHNAAQITRYYGLYSPDAVKEHTAYWHGLRAIKFWVLNKNQMRYYFTDARLEQMFNASSYGKEFHYAINKRKQR